MKPIKHIHLHSYAVHASLAEVGFETYQLTISDHGLPVKQVILFATSKRDAVRQFQAWLANKYPKSA